MQTVLRFFSFSHWTHQTLNTQKQSITFLALCPFSHLVVLLTWWYALCFLPCVFCRFKTVLAWFSFVRISDMQMVYDVVPFRFYTHSCRPLSAELWRHGKPTGALKRKSISGVLDAHPQCCFRCRKCDLWHSLAFNVVSVANFTRQPARRHVGTLLPTAPWMIYVDDQSVHVQGPCHLQFTDLYACRKRSRTDVVPTEISMNE